MQRAALALIAISASFAGRAAAQSAASGEAAPVDRTVARFYAPDAGGVKAPRFVYERVLSFEARLEALADPGRDVGARPYRSRHVAAALERHVAETLLASLHIDPEPTAAELARQMQSARARLVERVGGEAAFEAAVRAEGMGARDVYALFRRQAFASLYLDRMVTPMLEPTEAELRGLHARGETPYREVAFELVRPSLQRWYTARRLVAAVQAYYQNARGRLNLVLLGELPGKD